METMKSMGEIYLSLVLDLYRDIAECYAVAPREQRVEEDYLRRRFTREGLSFLTKALPRFGKAVDTALSKATPLEVQGFTLGPHGVPKLFGWLLGRVFDSRGVESVNSDSIALKHFRQLVYFLYKLEIPFESSQRDAVIDSFVKTDAELPSYSEACWTRPETTIACQIISDVLGCLDPRDINPCHGPGAVATGESTMEKSNFSRIYEPLDREYPFTEYFRYGLTAVCDTYQEIQLLETLDHATAKVVLVPKDSRGPRIISAEPLEVQWIQQGLGVEVEACINRHRLTRGFVNFTDQTVNQRLALAGSKNHKWVTLDMKDASDRVSSDLVRSLFRLCPTLLACLFACRSSHTRLPDGQEIPLNKFAPMGSRLCFPIESFCFYALILSALCMKYNCKPRKLVGKCFIFGDDIIVRREDYPTVLQLLPLFGLKFNESKCCTHGSFRESCGVDAHKGIVVTPVRLRTVWCARRKMPEVITSYVALRNAMVGRGYFRVARNVEGLLHSVYGRIPYTDRWEVAINGAFVSLAGGPAFVAHDAPAATKNWGMRKRFSPTHVLQIYSYITKPVKLRTHTDGWSELLRRHSAGFGASGGIYALPRRNRLKRGWMAL
jgi:hypothetical protein